MKEEIYFEKKNKKALLREFTANDLAEALRLRLDIWLSLEDKSMFAEAREEDFRRILAHGFGLVCVADNQIAACLFCILEGGEYAIDTGYEEELLPYCADYEDAYVHPAYRGLGLQLLMEQRMEAICKEKGKKVLLGTVSPSNTYSYQNFLKAGYREVCRKEKYNGLLRAFMAKRI